MSAAMEKGEDRPAGLNPYRGTPLPVPPYSSPYVVLTEGGGMIDHKMKHHEKREGERR